MFNILETNKTRSLAVFLSLIDTSELTNAFKYWMLAFILGAVGTHLWGAEIINGILEFGTLGTVAVSGIILGITSLSCYALYLFCDPFEEGAERLGQGFPPGVKGATINAIGSSMPELFITIAMLFVIASGSPMLAGEQIGASVSVTAGSAVFNSAIIPAFVIFTVLGVGIASQTRRVSGISVDRKAVFRDFVAVVVAELALIAILMQNSIQWWHGASLLAIYGMYVFKIYMDAKDAKNSTDETEDGSDLTTLEAWNLILWSTVAITATCVMLAYVVEFGSHAIGVHPAIIALVFAAAASSVPDTIMSIKMAKKGDYEDAIANVYGSNTFDICVAFGKPVLIYTLVFGAIPMPDDDIMAPLRIALVVFTILNGALILMRSKITVGIGYALLAMYLGFMFFALNLEFGWVSWLS